MQRPLALIVATLKRDKRSADYRHYLIAGKSSLDNILSATSQ